MPAPRTLHKTREEINCLSIHHFYCLCAVWCDEEALCPLYTGSDLRDPMVLQGTHITDTVSARRVMCTVSLSGSYSSPLSDESLSSRHYDCSRCLSLVQVLSTTFPKWIVNFCSYLWILTFFSSQIYIQFQFARHFFKQNYFLCSACIGLSLLPVARFHSVPRFISCLSYLLPADNQSVDPVSCQRPANR